MAKSHDPSLLNYKARKKYIVGSAGEKWVGEVGCNRLRRGVGESQEVPRLSGTGHGLLHGSLQAELRSLELVTGRVGVLELL